MKKDWRFFICRAMLLQILKKTKPCIININAISITQSCNNKHGNVAVIETDNAKITCKDPDNFFTEFENLISEEEW